MAVHCTKITGHFLTAHVLIPLSVTDSPIENKYYIPFLNTLGYCSAGNTKNPVKKEIGTFCGLK